MERYRAARKGSSHRTAGGGWRVSYGYGSPCVFASSITDAVYR
jgi:hypothetical protein